MRFRDLNLKAKQLISFSLVLVIFVVAGGFTIHRMSVLKDRFEEVAINWMPRSIAIAELSRGISNYRALALQHILTPSPFEKKSLDKLINLQIEQIQDYLDRYESLRDESRAKGLISPTEDSLYEVFDSDWDEYQSVFQNWYLLSQEKPLTADGRIVPGEGAENLITGAGAILHDNIRWTLEGLVDNINFEAETAATSAEKLIQSTRQIMALFLAISIALSAVIAIAMTRLIVNPLKNLAAATESVSQGDLEIKLDVIGKDEVASLAQSFDRMADSLREARDKMEQQAQKLISQNTELEATLKKLNETQEELLLKEKMASLGKLVASVAHEINSPIGTVISAADVSERAVERIEETLNAISKSIIDESGQLEKSISALKENIGLTITASRRIADIVQNLKSFSRLDESEFQAVDIHKGIESSIVLLGEKKIAGIEIRRDYSKLPLLNCNPGLLNQVFWNLITNAVNAVSEGGVITVKTESNASEVSVRITDNGAGIASDRLKSLFDFGFTASGKRVKMGTGLLTAYNIVQKHRGRIEVASEQGKGSTFSVILPLK